MAETACLRRRCRFTGGRRSLAGCLRGVAARRLGDGPEAVDAVEDRLGDGVLGGLRDLLLVAGGDQQNLVLGALEADRRVGDVVEDDQVGALAGELDRKSVVWERV